MCLSMDRFWWGVLLFVWLMVLVVYCTGCGASATSDMPVETNTKMIDENRSAIEGNANEIKTINVKVSSVENTVNSTNEAMEKAFKNEIGEVKGGLKNVQKNVTNSMWYAFGVLIIIGVVGLLGLVIILYFYRGFKGFGRT